MRGRYLGDVQMKSLRLGIANGDVHVWVVRVVGAVGAVGVVWCDFGSTPIYKCENGDERIVGVDVVSTLSTCPYLVIHNQQ